MTSLLSLENVETYIGQYHILQGVQLEVKQGGITVLLGRNGAGKTTALRTIMGYYPPTKGEITFAGDRLNGLKTFQIAKKGIGYVPEDQGIFPYLTVEEHIKVAIQKNDDYTKARVDWVLDLFPDLKTYWKKEGGHLSGGQKQMLAIARAFVNDNRLLLIDEPSKGLAPIVVEKVMEALVQIKEKTSILLVEQNFLMASQIGDSFFIMDDGKTVHSGEMEQLMCDEDLRKKYLGIA
ncbi:MAG TPA: ABC transporter ATP-binding protein [Bacillus sp. (in: firmicutes)]|uniref:ABC transporter ATP-binding protein n=1 Tax=Bacillus litorisediminis TaxID=2922713 RepID=UPI001FABBE4A|nr:ABC transporter ATP-binding protein [Bacillus litorisediminis]HWO75089.1 ABC transporter ATP-binding protein [Bacillus sp. (in: firmicutes)]